MQRNKLSPLHVTLLKAPLSDIVRDRIGCGSFQHDAFASHQTSAAITVTLSADRWQVDHTCFSSDGSTSRLSIYYVPTLSGE